MVAEPRLVEAHCVMFVPALPVHPERQLTLTVLSAVETVAVPMTLTGAVLLAVETVTVPIMLEKIPEVAVVPNGVRGLLPTLMVPVTGVLPLGLVVTVPVMPIFPVIGVLPVGLVDTVLITLTLLIVTELSTADKFHVPD